MLFLLLKSFVSLCLDPWNLVVLHIILLHIYLLVSLFSCTCYGEEQTNYGLLVTQLSECTNPHL